MVAKETKRIAKNSVIYMIRQVFSVIFPLITFAYSSRILGVAGIGQVNYAHSIANYFVMLAGLGISTYAIRTGAQIRDEKERINSFVTELMLINLISTVCSCVLFFCVVFFTEALGEYKNLLICFSLLIPFATLGIEWVYNIYEDFLYITIRTVLFQIISLVLMVLLVRNEEGVIVYALITVFSTVGANALNFVHARKYVRLSFANLNLTRHLKPVFLLFGMTVATTIYTTMDMTMLGMFSTDFQVGLYSAAHKVSKMLILAVGSIRTVALPVLSRHSNRDEGTYGQISNQILGVIVTIVLPIMVGVITYGDVILKVLSGEEYTSALPVLQLLGVDIFLAAMSGTLVYQYILLKVGEMGSCLITILGAVTNLFLNYIFIMKYQAVGAAIATCLSESVVMITSLLVSRKYISFAILSKRFAIACVACIPIISIRWITVTVFNNNLLVSLISIVLCVVAYFTVIFMCDKELMNHFRSNR